MLDNSWFDYSDIYDEAVDKYDNTVFCELGSFKGASAIYLAQRIKEKNKNIKVVCVDFWPSPKEINNLCGIGAGQGEESKKIKEYGGSLMQDFIDNVYKYNVENIIIPIRSSTNNACGIFPKNYFDFIFVDACHYYDQVKLDLQNWYPKLTVDGMIAGHDYESGVKKAVDEFFNNKIIKRGTSWQFNK